MLQKAALPSQLCMTAVSVKDPPFKPHYTRRYYTNSKKASMHLSRRRAAPCSLAASGCLRSPHDDMVWRALCLLSPAISGRLLVTQAVAARVVASLLLEARVCQACWVCLLLGVRLR